MTAALFTVMMPRLSRTSTFHFRLLHLPSTYVPPTTSNVSILKFELLGPLSPDQTRPILQTVLMRLTLPSLAALEFEMPVAEEEVEEDMCLHLPWPHPEFLSLAQRSSFRTHLKELYLQHVSITEPELLACLAALPTMERLSISDHQCTDHGEHLLVTDTLFEAPTWTPDSSCLVPRLSFLDCSTMLKFDYNVYVDYLLS